MTVNTVSSAWHAPARRSELRPGAAAALSQPCASSDKVAASPCSAVGIDSAFVQDPGQATGQGDEDHDDDAEDGAVVLGVAREHVLADEETEQAAGDTDDGQHGTGEKSADRPRRPLNGLGFRAHRWLLAGCRHV